MSDDRNPIVPTIVQMPERPSEAALAGEAVRRQEADIIKNAETIARIRRASYLAYINAGFDEKQAMELCTK